MAACKKMFMARVQNYKDKDDKTPHIELYVSYTIELMDELQKNEYGGMKLAQSHLSLI